MRWFLPVLLAAAAALGQGGRDSGGGKTVLFVRFERTAETGDIWLAAWSALEPHLAGRVTRERLAQFDGDETAGRAYLARFPETVLIVALDARAAALARDARPDVPVLEASPRAEADVVLRVDRERLAPLVRRCAPDARRIALFGAADESLAGFEVKRCATAADARGCDLAWVAEDGAWPEGLDAAMPVLSTSPLDRGRPVLLVRPDAVGAGQKIASLVVGRLRESRPFDRRTIARLHVTVDLDAAHRTGFVVPLPMLARADAVRRGS
jgi:hypothetical protein